MRILHTSDWHLGRTLHGHSRGPEHERFLDELVEMAKGVDVVLVSGDVFETTNPPIEAEELLYDALARLGDGGKRAVVVIAGNHDSPDRLLSTSPLTATHGVWVLGRPGDVPQPRKGRSSGVVLASASPSVLKLDLPSGERAVILAVPYPSEARLKQLLSPKLDERDLQRAYNQRLAGLFSELSASFEPGAVNLATSHLAIRSCMPGGSERVLIGGAWQVDGSILPRAQYVALGHIHLAQQVMDAPTLARYAGAPLPMRFSEKDFARNHVLIEVSPGGEPKVELVPIQAGRPLVHWKATSVTEVERRAVAGEDRDAFIDLELNVSTRPTHAELARIRRLPRDILRIRTVLPESELTPLELSQLAAGTGRRDVPISQLFASFYRETTGHEPARELTDLVIELTSEEGPDKDTDKVPEKDTAKDTSTTRAAG
jgi:exonuclease SbcD